MGPTAVTPLLHLLPLLTANGQSKTTVYEAVQPRGSLSCITLH